MRRPHVFERSAPRSQRDAHREAANQAVVARTIAAQLGNIMERAEAADLPELTALLETARLAAERLAAEVRTLEDDPR